MKYSQFIEMNKILENEDIQTDNVLNEIGIITPLIIAAASGIGVLFRKNILSWGVKKIYTQQLTNIAAKFRISINETVEKSIKTYQESTKKIKDVSYDSDSKQLIDLQSQVLKMLYKSIDSLSELKSKEVYDKIDKSKKMKDSSKMALKYYWETLTTDIKVGAISDLVTKNIITNKKLKEKIEKYKNSKSEFLKNKENEVKTNIKNVQIEEKKYKDKTFYENEIENIKNKQEAGELEKPIEKVKDLLLKANNNLSSEDYNTLVDELPDIEGLSKNQIRSTEGLRNIKF